MTIRMDIVEITGRSYEGIKFLGMIPEALELEDFNVYVRWDGDRVTADRSDTDRNLVASYATKNSGKLDAFQHLMTSLATLYGTPVVVAADPGIKVTAMAARMLGTYEPRDMTPVVAARSEDFDGPALDPDEFVAMLNNSDCVCDRIMFDGPRFEYRKCPCGSEFPAVIPVHTVPGMVWFDNTSDTHWITVRQAVTGDVKFRSVTGVHSLTLDGMTFSVRVRDGVMVPVGTFVAPVVGARYLSETGQTVHEITEVDGDTFMLSNGTRCNTLSLSWWVRDGELTPVGNGYRKSFRKHKSTAVSRKRNRGAA